MAFPLQHSRVFLQALVDQARDLRDATAYMKGHLPFNLPPAAAGARRA